MIRFKEEEKKKKEDLYGGNDNEDEEDDDDEKVIAAKKEKEEAGVQALIERDRYAPAQVPNLRVYLIPKKPKVRMVDAHIAGTRLIMKCSDKDGHYSKDGIFGTEEKYLEYTSSLKDIPESMFSQSTGIVILKHPDDPPVTTEPIIYCIVRLQGVKNISINTGEALHVTELSEKLSSIIEVSNVDVNIKPKERVKSLNLYRETASKCWSSFQLEEDVEIDFEICFKMLDIAELFMIKVSLCILI